MSRKLDTTRVSNILDIMTATEDTTRTTSFEEKTLWIQLAGLVPMLGGYFISAGMMLAGGLTDIAPFGPRFISALVAMVVIHAAGHAAIAILGTPEDRDERDRLIAWRAEAQSSWLLGAGVIVTVGCLVAGMGPAWIANLLLLSMFLSQTLCYTLQLVHHRWGI